MAERLAGFRPPLAPDPFEALVGAITAQQVSMFAAFAIRNRLVAEYGARGEYAYAFPRRERLAARRENDLLRLGFSRRKAEYVLALARSDLDFGLLETLPDDKVRAALVGLRGLGGWTADWFLARYLGRPTAWPAGDLALQKAISRFYLDGRPAKESEVRAFEPRFEPFQNLAAHYLLLGMRAP